MRRSVTSLYREAQEREVHIQTNESLHGGPATMLYGNVVQSDPYYVDGVMVVRRRDYITTSGAGYYARLSMRSIPGRFFTGLGTLECSVW